MSGRSWQVAEKLAVGTLHATDTLPRQLGYVIDAFSELARSRSQGKHAAETAAKVVHGS